MKPNTLIALSICALLFGCQIGTFTDPNGTGSTASNAKFESEPTTVMLYWSAPLERVNGDVMTREEIGGYEIRYRHQDSTQFTTVTVDAETTQWAITTPSDAEDFVFEVAVYDSDGIYSNFVRAASSG